MKKLSSKKAKFALFILVGLFLLFYRFHSKNPQSPVRGENQLVDLGSAFDSGNFEEVIRGVRRLRLKKDYAGATAALDRLLKESSEDKQIKRALEIQAGIYIEEREFKKAKLSLHRIINDFPGSRESKAAHLKLAGIYTEEADYTSSYLELLNSGLLVPIVILNFLFFLALAVLGSFLIMLIIRFFFRKQRASASDKVFMPADLYATIAMFLISPWLIIMIILPLNLLFGDWLKQTGIMPELFCMTASGVLLMGFCLLFLKFKYKLDNRTLGFFSLGAKFNLGLPILVVMATISLGILFSLLLTLLGVQLPETMNERIVNNVFADQNQWQIIYLFVVFTLVGPVSEEIVFRVFIQNFFKKHTNTVFAIIASSILFAAFHQSILLGPYFFIIGVILALLYARTKSIIPSIVTHGLYNSIFLFIGIALKNAQ